MKAKELKPQIAIDTREPEHTAYRFDANKVDVVRTKLDSADYSCVGHQDEWGIERKEIGDLVNTVIRCQGRFERELERLRSFKFARLLIEATPEDVVLHHYRAMVHPNAILGSVYSIEVDFGLPVIWAGDREHGQMIVQGLLTRLWNNAQRDASRAARAMPQFDGE